MKLIKIENIVDGVARNTRPIYPREGTGFVPADDVNKRIIGPINHTLPKCRYHSGVQDPLQEN